MHGKSLMGALIAQSPSPIKIFRGWMNCSVASLKFVKRSFSKMRSKWTVLCHHFEHICLTLTFKITSENSGMVHPVLDSGAWTKFDGCVKRSKSFAHLNLINLFEGC